MADIIALPCAAKERVVQGPRRGRLPNRYPSIPQILHRRRMEQWRREADAKKQLEDRRREFAAAPKRLELFVMDDGRWHAFLYGAVGWEDIIDDVQAMTCQIEVDLGMRQRAPVLELVTERAACGGQR
ncbi:hypothetical protein K7G19_19710 [Cupriavidus sp. DB3]|uniref:hypothetical protein n=1 Tax=Cupriavidus sp. DB3 TaxID=2873259 RepID=UPI001CF38F9A|nr:hypothetical protein [Cupriavidus sp. DB3]MCA7085819.1 hypothetical protein [Cupriavidus sp. DB3]